MPITLSGVTLGGGSTRGQIGIGGTADAIDSFVDSVGGNNSNAGTEAAPEQTLSAAAWGASARVALKRGSTWRESADDAIEIRGYGATGALPIIRGDDVLSSWSAHGSVSNAWTTTVAHEQTLTGRLTVYEDGALMTRVANAAALVPGSFVGVEAAVASPATITIMATGSGNPNSNGKVYEASARAVGILLGDNAKIDGVRAQRVTSNNGAVEAGRYANVRRVLSVYGTKHNMLVSSGLAEDCIACRADQVTALEAASTYFVGYYLDAAGLNLAMRRCFAVGDGYDSTGPALIMHDSSGHSFASFVGTQLATNGVASNFQPAAFTVLINGLFSDTAMGPFSCYSDDATINYLQAKAGANTTGMSLNGIVGGGTYRFRNCVFYDTGTPSGLIRLASTLSGCTLEFSNCVFYHAGFRSTMTSEGMSSGTVRVNNCIFVYTSNGNPIVIPSGVSYSGDNNVFVPETNVNLTYQGSLKTTIAAWRSATGQDANSIVIAAANLSELFSGTVANGDFTLGGAGAGAQASALLAGPQTHWDWNAGASASGPPTAWPDVPETLTESEAYVLNPSAWIF